MAKNSSICGICNKHYSTIRELKDLNSAERIYTNNPYAIYFYLDKNPNPFPTKINIYTAKKNINYTGDLNKTMEEIREKNGLIVLFDIRQFYLAEEKELLKDYKLILIKDTQDGAIYKVREKVKKSASFNKYRVYFHTTAD